MHDMVTIGGIRISPDFYRDPSFKGFWTEEKCRLLFAVQKSLGPELEKLLRQRQEFTAAINAGTRTMQFPKDSTIRDSEFKVADIPELYQRAGPELISPLRDPHMAILAAKAHGERHQEGLVSTVFDNCDAGHYGYTIKGIRDVTRILSGQYSTNHNGKDYKFDEDVDGRGVNWIRINGLGAKPLAKSELVQSNGHAIFRTLFETVFYASEAIDRWKEAKESGDEEKALLLAPKIYVPKIETAAEAAWFDKVCRQIEDKKGVPHGTIKVSLVVETPTIFYELPEVIYALRDRITKLSYGRYDALASAIYVNTANPKKLPPSPKFMSIKTAPAKYQFAYMVQMALLHGAFSLGGMDVPVGDSEEVLKSVEDNKAWEGLYVISAWISAPHHTTAAMTGLIRGMENSQLQVMLEMLITAEKLNEIPEGPINEGEVDFIIRKFIEFSEGYLRGIGCCSYLDKVGGPKWATMEDFATAGEYTLKVINTWVRHGAMMTRTDGTKVKIDKDLLAGKVEGILADIKQGYETGREPAKGKKMSVERFKQGYYRESALLFMAGATSPKCPTFVKDNVCYPAYRFLKVMSDPKETITEEDTSSWACSVLTHPKYYEEYSWYNPKELNWTYRESNRASEQNIRDGFWKADRPINPIRQAGCSEIQCNLVVRM